MMKKGLIRLLFFMLFACGVAGMNAQGSWERVEVPTQHHLRSVYFTDSLYGWAVGDSGSIIHTMDGGENWVSQDSETYNHIVHVFFLNRQLGWASSWNYEGFYGTLLLKTTDGGNSWSSEAYPEDYLFMNCILFLDSLTGWMGGSPHALVKTTDGGQSWNQAAIDTNALAFFPVLNLYFYDENHGYACGGMFDIAGVTWSTHDGGEMWYPINNEDAPADEVHGMHIFSSENVIGAGGDPDQGYGVAMIRTSNGGLDWNYEELSMSGNAFDIDFRNENEAWAPLGPGEKLIYSMDAGTTWTEIDSPENTAIFDMVFTDDMHGYGVGYNGAFIRYKPQGLGIIEADGIDTEFRVFPNPSDGRVNFYIERENWKGGEVQIYDLTGSRVWMLPMQNLSATIDLSHIPAGIYICKLLLLGEEISRQKLILR